MKKMIVSLGAAIVSVGVLMGAGGADAGVVKIPAAGPAIQHSAGPAHSPVINEDWELVRYYVHSDDAALMAELGVRHKFKGTFSTEMSRTKAQSLADEGFSVEEVEIYQLFGKAVCGDGVCQGNESRTCAIDCLGTPPPTGDPGRSCFSASQYPWGINRVNGGSGGAGVTVAVLDSGVKIDHPDITGNVRDCVDMTARRLKYTCADSMGHGTHVAGTILADGGADGRGIYGVAPQASLAAVKVCGDSGCYADDMAAGIYYAADNGANIISMSLGGQYPDSGVLAAIDYAVARDVLVIAAAGNQDPFWPSSGVAYPGAYYKVVAVGATNINDQVASWSLYGPNNGDTVVNEGEVELAGPGVDVESTYNNGCYTTMSGTSMATPHVSGLAAKLWKGSASATRAYLHSIAQDINAAGIDARTGFGLPVAP